MDTDKITELTLEAWKEDESDDEPEASVETVESEDETPPEEESDAEPEESEPAEPETDEPVETEEEQPEAEAEEEEEEEVAAEAAHGYESDNPAVQAYLAKYQGDAEKALVAATHLQQVLGRQGQEKAVLTRRVEELEQELTQVRRFGQGAVLSPEQRQWADQAVESENPSAYVQQAVQAGEFGLARAVCDQWAQEAPYEAARAAQVVDAAEWNASQADAAEPVQFDRDELLDAIADHYPDMPEYSEKMTATLASLGETHPLVQDARSHDPETAARAIIGIYEIARAQSASVKTTRAKVQRDGQEAADDARRRAVVSSAQANPKPSEAPRPRKLMPGLTLEDLDAAWSS